MRKRRQFYRLTVLVSVSLLLVALATDFSMAQRGFRDRDYDPVREFEANSFSAGDIPGPQAVGGDGALSSSIYGGGASQMPQAQSDPGPQNNTGTSGTELAATHGQKSVQVYDPMQPMGLDADGRKSALQVARAQGTPMVVKASSDLAQNADEAITLTRPALTSLAPSEEGDYQNAMLQAEADLKAKDYPAALQSFQQAQSSTSSNTPEPLVGLFLASLGTSQADYTTPADYLGQALRVFPALPMAKVDLDAFFADGEYTTIKTALSDHVEATPTDAHAMFVLAYLDLRDGEGGTARQMLDAAFDASTDLELTKSIQLMDDATDTFRETVAADEPDLQDAQEYPWAGISMALPEGFVADRLTQINKVFVASGGTPQNPMRASLSIYPLSKAMDLETVMEAVTKSLDAEVGVLDVKVEGDAMVPFMGQTAMVRLMTCDYAGNEFAGVRICFLREVADGSGSTEHLAYVLGLGMLEGNADDLLPAMAAMARSIKFTDFTRPIDLPVPEEGMRVSDMQLGFAIDQPVGWVGTFDEDGFSMGQFDFIQGGTISPRVDVITATFPSGMTAQELCKTALEAKADEGIEITVISHREVQLAGGDGYEVLFQKDAPATDELEAESTIEMARVVAMSSTDSETKMLALVVRTTDSDVEQTKAIMEAVAPKLSLIGGAD